MGRKGALAQELGASPPAGVLHALSEDELQVLADAIHAARRRQSAAVKAAGEQALSNLPWLIRGPAKKIVGAMS
jgi:hypothetical protein